MQREGESAYLVPHMFWIKWAMIGMTIINLLVELMQVKLYMFDYLKDMENLLQLSIFTMSLVLVWDVSACASEVGLKADYQWQLAAVNIFFAWLNLIFLLKMMPYFGIYIIMFNSVTITFMRFFLIFSLFIFGFGFAFYILLSNQTPFDTVGNSMLKTGVMIIGEIGFSDMFNGRLDDPSYDNNVFFTFITYSLFIVFLILMNVIVMNLLVGLAVEDIAIIQNEASIQKLCQTVHMALRVESWFPFKLQKRMNRVTSYIPIKSTEAHQKKDNVKKKEMPYPEFIKRIIKFFQHSHEATEG
ncbi:hypothetical protein Ciccas_014590, partial [Cichlidogyrus casuarinus]